MIDLPSKTREALAREAFARDVAAGASLVRGAVVRAGAILGGIVSLGTLGLMFTAGAALADSGYLFQPGPHALDVAAPHPAGALLTLAVLGVGMAVLGIGIIRPVPDPARPGPSRPPGGHGA